MFDKDFLLFASFLLGMLLLSCAFGLWIMKKAGLEPCGSFTKLFYDGYTGGLDSRITHHRRFHFQSKSGAGPLVEIAVAEGSLYLEFFTRDRIAARWQMGDATAFFLELPPGERVWLRGRMDHFTGSITFRRRKRPLRHAETAARFLIN